MHPVRKTLMACVLASALLAGACGGGSGDEADGSSDAGGDSGGGMAEALPITVTAAKFKFDPKSFEGHATHTFEMTFVNEDDTQHSFTIDEMEVDIEAAGGEEVTEEFTPEETGSFEYYCKYHPDTMKGKLEVS